MGIRKGLPAKLALTDANDTRYDFNNLVVTNADGSPRGGLTSPVGATILTGTATMALNVNGPWAAVAVRDGGVILLASDGPDTVTLADAPASNQRTDIIYAKQNDASSTVTSPDPNNNAVVGVVTGTPGPSGGTPGDLPPGAVEIGRVIVTAGNTNTNAAIIAQSSTFTASAGGVVPFAAYDYLTDWTNARPGQKAYVFADTPVARNREYVFDGASWTFSSPIEAAGIATVGATGVTTFTFPTNRFSLPPILTATVITSASSVVSVVWIGENPTAASFKARIFSLSAAQIAGVIHWRAIQKGPNSSAG